MTDETSEWEERERAMAAEAQAYLLEEFSDDQVVEAIHRVWRRFLSWDEDEIDRLRMIVRVFDAGYASRRAEEDGYLAADFQDLLRDL